MSGEQEVIVAVDFDGTITDRDCVTRFLLFEFGSRDLIRALVKSRGALVGAVLRADRGAVKAIITSWFRGRERGRLESSGRRFAELHISKWLREDVLSLIEAHRQEGARIVIVSASYDLYVFPIASRIGAEAVLATELEFVDGVATGDFAARNCRGEEKVRRLVDWMRLNNSSDGVHVIAYGDSSGDGELLAFAHEGILVDRRSLWRR